MATISMGAVGYMTYGAATSASHVAADSELNPATTTGIVGLPPSARDRIKSAMAAFGGTTAATGVLIAAALANPAVALRLFGQRPMVTFGLGLAGSLGGILGVNIAESDLGRNLSLGVLATSMAVSVIPAATFLPASVVMQAGLASAVSVGSMALMASQARTEDVLSAGVPLMAGLGVVAAASIGSLVLPSAWAASSVLHSVSLYGGVGIFTLLSGYDAARVMHHARVDPDFNPQAQCVGMYMNLMNLFIRYLAIFGGSKRK